MIQNRSEIILQNLTICIFTFERPVSLLRIIDFYSKYNIQLIILDASADLNTSAFPAKIRYFHMPGASVQERFIKFSSLASTQYLLLSPDDDFFAIKGLVDSLIFLDRHQEFSSVQGLRIRTFDYPNFHWIPDYTKYMKSEFIGDDKTHRVLTMGKQMHYIYSVFRHEVYAKIVSCLVGAESQSRNSVSIVEIIFNLTLPALGKHKTIPCFYSARMDHSYKGGDINFARWVNSHKDITAINLRRNLVDFYMREIPCSEEDGIKLMEEMIAHFSKQSITTSPRNHFKKLKMVMRSHNFAPIFRSISLVLKPNYLNFFWILIINRNFRFFVSDIRHISSFLKQNKIK